MNRAIPLVLGFLPVILPVEGLACEPILPLAQLLSGSSAAGPIFFTQSVFWLLLAIVIKSVAFVCFEKRLTWVQAAFFMLMANIVSTIPGVLLAQFNASAPIGGLLFALPIVYALGWMVQRRLQPLFPSSRLPRITCVAVMVAFAMFHVASMFLYGFTQVALDNRNHAGYWILKFLFVSLVAGTGIVISAVLEEGVIARLSARSGGNVSFHASVIRANYVTLATILLVAAVAMLPRRLRSPGFLTSWLEQVCASIGLS